MSQSAPSPPEDLADCAREPIRVPGSIQPHGMLLALDGTGDPVVLQASANVGPLLGQPAEAACGRRLAVLGAAGAALAARLARLDATPGTHHLGRVPADFTAVAHLGATGTIVEIEPAEAAAEAVEAFQPLVRGCLAELEAAGPVEALCAIAASAVRRMSGFDRALVYRFDTDWNGEVIAEDRNAVLPSYLGHRFPAADIPAQARELYRLNRLRLIADANYTPVPIVPAMDPRTGIPLDLSQAALRSVSPVHLEYMRNMGTLASMSVSLLHEGSLWGLIACHGGAPHLVSPGARGAAELLGQILSLQISAHERRRLAEERLALRSVGGRLLAAMAGADHFTTGLVRAGDALLALTNAAGAAVVEDDDIHLVGSTPPRGQVRALADWVAGQNFRDMLQTDSLETLYPPAAAHRDRAAGLLAVSISQTHPSCVLWFRPELLETVRWAGDPRKGILPGATRLDPRKSFETWTELVRGRARRWSAAEVAAARTLRTGMVDIVLRRAEELAGLTEELRRSNRELESFSYSVSHDLRAPFRHIVGYAELLREREGDRLTDVGRRYVDKVMEAAAAAGALVDNLLSFSRMARAELTLSRVDMEALVADVIRRMAPDLEGRSITWRIGALGTLEADPALLRIAVENLIANAAKFTRGREPAIIAIDRSERPDSSVFAVRDNGSGFDMAYVDKLFGVFQRLHRADEFEGTGIGLANARRIVERHGGATWAEGELGKGASFFFSLPRRARRGSGGDGETG